jgi:pyruvate dehydrogenase E2 component (dihydrolipoamide acetyltransferase)
MPEFVMPSLGADMDAGTVLEWRIGVGDEVRKGDVVAVVETDKSDLEVESFVAGTVAELLVPIGVRVAVGTPLARLTSAAAPSVPPPSVPPPSAFRAQEDHPQRRSDAQNAGAGDQDAEAGSDARLTSPMVRHLADELHVDVTRLQGTGSGGRIARRDVEQAALRATPTPATRERVTPRARRLARAHGVETAALASTGRIVTGDDVLAMVGTATPPGPPPAAPPAPPRPADGGDRMRRAIAATMTRAWTEIPHYHAAMRIDVATTLTRLSARNEGVPPTRRVLASAVFLRAAAQALRAVPELCGWWRDGAFVPGDGIHVATVVALRRGGLLAPVVRDAADKDLDTVMADLRDLVTRARNGRLRASEVDGATFTVTDLGEMGADSLSPVIHPPQVAILGLGAVRPEAWATADGLLGVRPVLHATLAGDHRATDGRIGSRYLLALSDRLQEVDW